MQLRALTFTAILAAVLLHGCKVSTQLPLKAEDIQICVDSDKAVATVKDISAQQGLRFHYGTHATDYGIQTTFRLIGDGYELELFNSMSQSDYTLRVYRTQSGRISDQEAELRFDKFRTALVEATHNSCK